jgi:hypothetical protein
MKQYYIYKTTNLIDGKQYIGKHYGELNDSYLGSGKILKRALARYGKENFKKEILCITQSNEENNIKEKEYIKLYNAVESDLFYNLHEGGDGGNNNQKISESLSGENHPMYGKHHSEETKEKLRQASLAYWTEERRKERSEQYKGENNPMYGKKKSAESERKRIEHTDFSAYRDEEYRRKMSIATSGEKNGNYGNVGEKAKNGKRICMCDKDWNVIKVFNTKRLALEFLNTKNHSSLNDAIRRKREYKGYYWKDV